MCGIAGVLNGSDRAVSPAIIKKMTDILAHRGPDGEGMFVEGNVGLGHRRLAIIDLTEAGHQPMTTPDGRYTISYNGEVYNFRELRHELESLGCSFRSRTDTEVVLQAYAQWGKDALHRFNGMFALAIWDRLRRELFVARDRYGIKPLYYLFRDGAFVFGSEIKAILQHPSYRPELDRPALLEYMTFQNFFTDRTLFKDIQLLPAGSYLIVRPHPQPAPTAPVQYWDWNFRQGDDDGDEREYVEELNRLFVQAVKRQLVSDVDVGAYLSGGIDSGSITAVAAAELPYIRTFTCGFDLHSASGLELAFDEREKAEYLSFLFKTEHYEMVLKAGDLERSMARLAWHIEEPRVGQCYPNYYVAQLAGKFVKVVLCGTGGDELFGGYPWRYYRAVVNDSFEHYIDKYYDFWQRLIPNKIIRKVFDPIWSDVENTWTRDIFRGVFKKHLPTLTRPEDYVNHSLYFEAKTFLGGLLLIEDKLSMAHGLESRVPFLDNDLVDFAMRVPVHFKLGNLSEVVRINENNPGPKTSRYFNKSQDGKLLLRKCMARHVPAEIADGIKQGFSAPDASWFKGESIDYVRRTLLSRDARIFEFLDRTALRQLVSDHLEGRENRRLLIWSLLYLETWLTKFLP
ncbi:MAG: asparagine synthase (glutamine-hydrolyzing) [Planctomycetaceae bacterium]|nr:asparagine synthase (glutamine-hydrolyzing) [Planctomycetaceae bacterium]